MASNPRIGHRQRLPLELDPAARVVLPADLYQDSLRPARAYPTVPLHPTRIDIVLEPREMEVVDFFLPEEPSIWEDWHKARVLREAHDAELTGFSECVVLEGSNAEIRRVSHKTRRVMEKQQRFFRFAVDHTIDTPDPDLKTEPLPVRIVVENPMTDSIRASAAAARARGVNQRPKQAKRRSRRTPKRRSVVPWGYVAGLGSALALLSAAKFLHFT